MSTDFGTMPPDAPRSSKTNTLAIISLVCGLLSIPLICCWPVGIVSGIAAVALGLISRNQIAKTGEGGGGLAIAGAVIGAIMVVATVVLVAVGMSVDVEGLQRQLQQNEQPGIEQPGIELGEPGELNSDFGSQAPAEEMVRVSAVTMFAEYDANEIAADQKYKGRLVEVSGQVDSIARDLLDNIYVTLKTDNAIFRIQCFFSDNYEDQAAKLAQGQDLRIRGRCDGKLGNVMLKDCVILE